MELESKTQVKTGLLAHITHGCGRIKSKALDLAKKIQKVGQDDPRRITHSLKVGLAITLVSLFYYVRPLYNGFGSSSMWAVFTVVVVFEFSVGATLSKSMNRVLATLLAGALGVGAQHLANLFGDKGEPYILGILVFLLAAASTYTRFVPHIKARYDYGVLIFILTFSLVSVSGYRVEKILELAHQRLSTIMLGGAMCMLISIFVCPVWAGEDLHNLVVNNIENLASFLEGFGGEYFKVSEDGGDGVMVPKENKSFLQSYKSVLNTKTTEESLANFAWWEPGHGSFQFRHPWTQYLKIGVLTRKCAFHIETLCVYINSEIQTPTEFQRKIQVPCMKMSSESGKALKELASAMKTMTHSSSFNVHIENSKKAVDDLKTALETTSSGDEAYLLEIIPAVTAASILTDIIKCVEKVADCTQDLSQQAHFKKEMGGTEKPQLFRRGSAKPVGNGNGDGDGDHVVVTVVHGTSSELPKNGNFSQEPNTSQRAVEA
ncbi:unnamed protein product [Camellia sinensis]